MYEIKKGIIEYERDSLMEKPLNSNPQPPKIVWQHRNFALSNVGHKKDQAEMTQLNTAVI